MKVLHVLDHSIPLHSGYTFRTAAILREQRALGWETYHLTSTRQSGCTAMEETVDGLHFYRSREHWLRHLPGMDPFAVMAATRRRLFEVARRLKPDLIHAHSPVLNVLPALQVARRLGIPVVYEIRAFWEDAAVDHGSTQEDSLRYRATRALETYAVKQVDHVFTICEGLRGDLMGRGVPAEKVTVIPNAVDIEKFSLGGAPDPALKLRLGLGNARVIGFIGSFYAYEGLDLLLRALPDILRRAPDIKVLFTGGGPQDEALKAQVMRMDLKDRVIFTGRVDHKDVNRYYDLVDVLVYARYPMRLTDLVTPLKPLEAMAQGRLFVASDVGGHKELIRDGETGVLFRAGDARDLADKVVGLLEDTRRWPQFKEQGRHFVEHERNWKASVARYRDAYRALVRDAA